MRSLGFYYNLSDDPICPKTMKECPVKINSNGNDKYGSSSKNDEAEIHCNLWKIQCNKTRFYKYKNPIYDYLLDVGIKFNPIIKKLALYFPFELTNEKITDLGQNMVQDQELCCLIFNEDVVTTHGKGCFSQVEFNRGGERKESLWIYHIGETNYSCEVSKEKQTGTILKINIESNPDHGTNEQLDYSNFSEFIYIRFRIKLTDLDLRNFKREEALSKDIIQSLFSKMELFDFRINDKREINKKVDEHLQSNGYLPFKMTKVHFLLACDIRNNVEKASMPYSSRFIETDKWNSYLCQPVPQSMVAYQWKDQKNKELIVEQDKEILLKEGFKLSDYISWERSGFSNFRLFVMLTYPQRSMYQILFYCLLAIILGAIGSIVASLYMPSSGISNDFWLRVIIGILIVIGTLKLWMKLKNLNSVDYIQ